MPAADPGDEAQAAAQPQFTAEQRTNARRALTAYHAMQAHFHAADGTSLYHERPRTKMQGLLERVPVIGRAVAARRQVYAYLWPFSRALAATLDLEGVHPSLLPGFNAHAAMDDRDVGLARYWDAAANPPAYDSGVRPPQGSGGDKYYDDNAWVALSLVQHYRLRNVANSLQRAEGLFAFALTGWDRNAHHAHPGGIFWVQQGVGRGRRDHRRSLPSNAPNAELGLHLQEITGHSAFGGGEGTIGASEIYAWVNAALDKSRGTNRPHTGLYFSRISLNGEVDKKLWTYNQGSMIGANVLLHRRFPLSDAAYLARAETIAHKALDHFAGHYFKQAEHFNAIFFRNLLMLHRATSDTSLAQRIHRTISTYAEEAWRSHRSAQDLFPKRRPTLAKQAGMVQIYALLAWDPSRYDELA